MAEDAQLYAPWKPKFNPWIVALTVTLATFMEVLDTSIANVALPHIAGGLSASQDEATWVLTSYLVSNAVVLPISAWLSVLVGRKRFYMSCVAIFTVSSFLCGLAPTLGLLVAFRVMQGLGGGGLATSEQAILADTFSPEKRGMAFAIYGMAVVMAPAIGPTLGGWITDNYSWRWIFYLNVPVGVISLYLTHKIVEDPPYMATERGKMLRNSIDYVGLGLIGVGIGCLQVVLDKGQELDWFASRMIVSLSVISFVTIVWFIRNEWQHSNPILDVRLLQQKNFATAAFMMFILGVVLFGTTVLIPQFLQVLLGYTAQTAGEALSLGAILLMVMMPIVGQLVSRVDPRYLIFFGFSATAMALYHMTSINLEIDFRTAAMYRVYQTMGLAFIFIPINTLSYVGIPRHKSNQVAGITNLSQPWRQRGDFHAEHVPAASAAAAPGVPDGLRVSREPGIHPAGEWNREGFCGAGNTGQCRDPTSLCCGLQDDRRPSHNPGLHRHHFVRGGSRHLSCAAGLSDAEAAQRRGARRCPLTINDHTACRNSPVVAKLLCPVPYAFSA